MHNESLFPLNSLTLHLQSLLQPKPFSSSLSFSKIPKSKSHWNQNFRLQKIPFFSTLSPFLRSGRNFGKGRRPAGVRRCSGGCSQRRLQPAATAASGSSCCCCCCSLLLRQQQLLLLLQPAAAAAAAAVSCCCSSQRQQPAAAASAAWSASGTRSEWCGGRHH